MYRIVVAEHARGVKRASLEIIGNYNPSVTPQRFSINKTKYDAWVKKGAQPTPRILYLVKSAEKVGKQEPRTTVRTTK